MNDGLGDGRVGAPIGGEMIGKGWVIFFWAAALFNFAIGLLGMLSPEATVDSRIISLLVFCFGIIYLLVARDPRRYASTLWAGVIGKVGVVGLLAPPVVEGGRDPLILGVLAFDGLFALGFLAFLLTRGDDS